MANKINVGLMKRLRNEKSWPQDQLARISGLSLRTIQRIEKSGKASFESKKSIASAFEINSIELDENENKSAFIDEKTDAFYFRVEDGSKITEIIDGVHACRMNHDDPKTEGEMELISRVLQSIHDWGQIWSDLDVGDRVKSSFNLTQLIDELKENGFWVFALRTNEECFGVSGAKFAVANIFIMRSSSPKIIKLDLENMG